MSKMVGSCIGATDDPKARPKGGIAARHASSVSSQLRPDLPTDSPAANSPDASCTTAAKDKSVCSFKQASVNSSLMSLVPSLCSRIAVFGDANDERISMTEYDGVSLWSQEKPGSSLTTISGADEASGKQESTAGESASSAGTVNTNQSSLDSIKGQLGSKVKIRLRKSSSSPHGSAQDMSFMDSVPSLTVVPVSAGKEAQVKKKMFSVSHDSGRSKVSKTDTTESVAASTPVPQNKDSTCEKDFVSGSSHELSTPKESFRKRGESLLDATLRPIGAVLCSLSSLDNKHESDAASEPTTLKLCSIKRGDSLVATTPRSFSTDLCSQLSEEYKISSISHGKVRTCATSESVMSSNDTSSKCYRELCFDDLPREVLLKIVQFVPTVSLIACMEVHDVFADLLSDIQFLNSHTRSVLGFPASQKDITYAVVPAPVEPVQDLWFQAYLHRVAPYLAGVVRPGVVFYNLMCFKHLLDTWLLQGKGYKYWMFVSDIIKTTQPPPLSLLKCKRFMTISKRMLHMLTKMALCNPMILLSTLNDFEEFSIGQTPPSELDDAWDNGVPPEWKQEHLQETCELVSRQRGLSLASFFLGFDEKQFFGWSGIIDYSTFRFKDTWGLCKCEADLSMDDCRQICQDLFSRFLAYTGVQYINIHCTNAFFFRSLNKLILQRAFLMPQVQELLEKTALSIHGKLKRGLPPEKFAELKFFLDRARFLGNSAEYDADRLEAGIPKKLSPREMSKTTEVAVQRYLHRYLNTLVGKEVLCLYSDPVCHHILCINCRNTNSINVTPFSVCMERVGPQCLPLKIWPPHLLHQALHCLPSLAKLVRLDVELWKRSILSKPLTGKVETFIKKVLGKVFLDFTIDQEKTGIIVQRLTATLPSCASLPDQISHRLAELSKALSKQTSQDTDTAKTAAGSNPEKMLQGETCQCSESETDTYNLYSTNYCYDESQTQDSTIHESFTDDSLTNCCPPIFFKLNSLVSQGVSLHSSSPEQDRLPSALPRQDSSLSHSTQQDTLYSGSLSSVQIHQPPSSPQGDRFTPCPSDTPYKQALPMKVVSLCQLGLCQLSSPQDGPARCFSAGNMFSKYTQHDQQTSSCSQSQQNTFPQYFAHKDGKIVCQYRRDDRLFMSSWQRGLPPIPLQEDKLPSQQNGRIFFNRSIERHRIVHSEHGENSHPPCTLQQQDKPLASSFKKDGENRLVRRRCSSDRLPQHLKQQENGRAICKRHSDGSLPFSFCLRGNRMPPIPTSSSAGSLSDKLSASQQESGVVLLRKYFSDSSLSRTSSIACRTSCQRSKCSRFPLLDTTKVSKECFCIKHVLERDQKKSKCCVCIS